MMDPFQLFALLQLFAIAADGLGAEFVLAAVYGKRMRPICHIPVEVLQVGLTAASTMHVCLVDPEANPEEQ